MLVSGKERKPDAGCWCTFQVSIKESASLKFLDGAKDLLPCKWGKVSACGNEEGSG
jgi:hypothetical protein